MTMKMNRALLAVFAASCVTLFMLGRTDAAEPMLRRATISFVARDTGVTRPAPPPPSDGYCVPSGAGVPAPPNSILGHLKIGDLDAPAGTIVRLRFDGQDGPATVTSAAGGYRIDYAAGGAGHVPPCINQVGAAMSVYVNGTQAESGVKVGDGLANPVLFFDVAVP